MTLGISYEIVGGSLSRDELQNLLKLSYHYDKKNPASYKGFKVDPQLSGTRAQVYYNASTGQAVIAHRGTQGLADWYTDAQMFWGNRSGPRFQHALKIQRQAEVKYGAENLTTIGHSLGAALASESGGKSKEIIAFNGPTTIDRLHTGQRKNQFDVRSQNDPVSIMKPWHTDQDRTHTIKSPSWWDPLREHKTDTLGRESADTLFGRGLGREPAIFGIPR